MEKKCLITTASSLHDSETFLSVRRQVGKFKVQVSCQDVVAAFPFALETSLAHLLFRRIMKDANKANRKMKMTKMFKTLISARHSFPMTASLNGL